MFCLRTFTLDTKAQTAQLPFCALLPPRLSQAIISISPSLHHATTALTKHYSQSQAINSQFHPLNPPLPPLFISSLYSATTKSISPAFRENLPRFFAKSGYVDVDPKKVKKDGSGKGNWGSAGEEVVDEGFRFTNARRRSNSFSHHHLSDFKTKFEVNETDPVFEEHIHGPLDEENGDDLSKTDSAESVHSV
ncbi:hypothetical protein V8C42DRAFT_118016 [Trichoderma barbatum]